MSDTDDSRTRHSHTRFRNDDGPWSPCPPSCPAAEPTGELRELPKGALIGLAWHDVVCPEGEDCRDRSLHAAAQTIANTGHLAAFLDRLAALTAPLAGQHITDEEADRG